MSENDLSNDIKSFSFPAFLFTTFSQVLILLMSMGLNLCATEVKLIPTKAFKCQQLNRIFQLILSNEKCSCALSSVAHLDDRMYLCGQNMTFDVLFIEMLGIEGFTEIKARGIICCTACSYKELYRLVSTFNYSVM